MKRVVAILLLGAALLCGASPLAAQRADGGKALKWLSRLDYPLAKTGETVNGGAESAVHLDR